MVAFQPVVHHASRITHHIVAGYQGEVYCVLKAEGNVVLPVISAVRLPRPGLLLPSAKPSKREVGS